MKLFKYRPAIAPLIIDNTSPNILRFYNEHGTEYMSVPIGGGTGGITYTFDNTESGWEVKGSDGSKFIHVDSDSQFKLWLTQYQTWQKKVNSDITNLSQWQIDYTKKNGNTNNLTTTSKELVGAINEINAKQPLGLKILHKQVVHMSVKVPAYTFQLETYTSDVLLESGLKDCVICHPFVHFNNPADQELKDLFYDIKAVDYDSGELYITISWNNRASHDMTKEYTLFFDLIGFGV